MASAAAKRLSCPTCGWSNIRLSDRAGFLDWAVVLLALVPLRCRNCRLRFYRPWFLAKRAVPLTEALRAATAPVTLPDDPTPLEVPPLPEVLSVPPPNPAPVASRGTILLLDDDPALRKLLGRILARDGYEIREAGVVGEGLELRGSGIDLAVVNLSSPEEGEEAVRMLRNLHAELLVILLSETLPVPSGPQGPIVLPKPAHVLEVAERVRSLMSPVRPKKLNHFSKIAD